MTVRDHNHLRAQLDKARWIREEAERESALVEQKQERNMARTKAPQGDVYRAEVDHDAINNGVTTVQKAADAALDAMRAAQEREREVDRLRKANHDANAARFKGSDGPTS